MAKYKRQKVKRYRRSFYSRGTRIKKGIGIVVLVVWLLWFGMKLVDNNRDVETVTLFFNYAVVYAVLPVAALAIGGITIARMRERLGQ